MTIDLQPNSPGAVASLSDLTRAAGAQRQAKSYGLTLLHLFCIGIFAAFLCWGQTGQAPINGDDVGVLQRTMLQHTNYNYDYVVWTQLRLHVVGLLYGEYKLAGSSLETANLIWLGIYVLSAFAGYAYLRKVFSPTVALTGAIFYLCYSSKYEPLTWWSAGAYTVIWLAFFGLMYAFESKWSYRVKSVVVTAIIAASMYLYEVFIVLVPVLSALMLLRRKREVDRLSKSDWILAALPIIFVAVHVLTLASTPEPIFNPSKGVRGGASLVQRIGRGFSSAIDATMGPAHNRTVKQASGVYKEFYQRETPALNLIMCAGIAAFMISLVLGARVAINSAPSVVAVNETALIGAVALFVSAFIGFVSNYCITPSRLTGIPSIGLMLLVCAALEWTFIFARKFSGVKRSAMAVVATLVPLMALAVSVREVKAFHSLLRQAGEVNAFDLELANRIKSLHPVARQGDEIYVRMPKAPGEATGRWQNFWSGFNSGRAFETFWYLYDVPAGKIDFKCTRSPAIGENVKMQEIVDRWSEKGSTRQVYPFLIDIQKNVMPITEIILTDVEGRELKRIDFTKQFAGYSGEVAPPQRIPVTQLPAKAF
ncbi:MAG: hypothetical protein U0103_19540 [Candidatus Obscuribacterales bacterium]